MFKYFISSFSLLSIALCMSNCSEDSKDTTLPVISSPATDAGPLDCSIFHRGDVIPVAFVFSDDTELGNYSIDIHHNFDHHSHSTSAVECDLDKIKTPSHAWVYNVDYPIPSGRTSYTTRFEIPIPSDIETGDYHFMIHLTDASGWQQFKGISIKIVDAEAE